jgi:hypothetical protein
MILKSFFRSDKGIVIGVRTSHHSGRDCNDGRLTEKADLVGNNLSISTEYRVAHDSMTPLTI